MLKLIAPLTGTIVQINISPGGLPKRPVAGRVATPFGLEGDGWAHPRIHGGPEKALLLMHAEVIDDLAARGYPVFYGALGENLTVSGLDRGRMRLGQQFRAGAAVIELTRVRVPCRSLDVYGPGVLDEIFDTRVKALDASSPRWGMSGFYARVLVAGLVRTDDIIALMATPA